MAANGQPANGMQSASSGLKDVEGQEARDDAVTNDVQALEVAQEPNGHANNGEVAAKDVIVSVTFLGILREFSILGWTAFGGPAAHIALFQKRFVEKLFWMTQAVYMELFSLGQFLPGPTSTQVSFAIGTIKKGALGGLLSGALFQYPGAIIMTAVGALAANILDDPAPWLSGITAGVSAVGVALVASATKAMCFKLCSSKVTSTLCTIAAVATILWPKTYMFPVVIAFGGIVTIIVERATTFDLSEFRADDAAHIKYGMFVGGLLLAIWLSVLVVVVVLVALFGDSLPEPLQWFEVFYRTGSIIYGGGQVVLPMLLDSVVQYNCTVDPCVVASDSWVTPEQFYAGLGVVQALPGPLFNFAAYLGAIIAINAQYLFLWGSIICWVGLFAPGILLIFGVLPFWSKFRSWSWYRRALPGLNAAAIGLIVQSVFVMAFQVYEISPFPQSTICIGIIAFTAVDTMKWFEPAVVLGGVALGVICWAGNLP